MQFNDLEKVVSIEAAVEVSFGFEMTISLSVVLAIVWEHIMSNSIAFMAYVRCEVAFLRGLAGRTSIQARDGCMRMSLPTKRAPEGSIPSSPHQFMVQRRPLPNSSLPRPATAVLSRKLSHRFVFTLFCEVRRRIGRIESPGEAMWDGGRSGDANDNGPGIPGRCSWRW